MGKNGKRLRINGSISVILCIIAIWAMVFPYFVPGVFLLLFAIEMMILGFKPARPEESTRSFWSFDRNEKGNGDDVDRIIQR
jgi:hypothetical protein